MIGMHKIRLGTDVREADEFLVIESIPIAEKRIHPQYNDNTLENDYWMIRLEWASQLYAPVELDTPSVSDGLDLEDGNSHELVVMGFGTLTSGGSTPNVMQEVTVDYKPNDACGSYPSGEITDVMLCAGRVGKDSCQVRREREIFIYHKTWF